MALAVPGVKIKASAGIGIVAIVRIRIAPRGPGMIAWAMRSPIAAMVKPMLYDPPLALAPRSANGRLI